MRFFPGFLAILFLANLAPQVHAEEWDDTILSQQVVAAVDRYRVIMRDFTQMEANAGSPADPLENPRLKSYVEDSVNPAESEMHRLFQQYQQEHGLPAFRRLAEKYEFKDLTQ